MQKGAAGNHPPTAPFLLQHRRSHHAAGLMIAGVTLPAGGSAFDRNGPSTLRALAHAPISSAFSPNRYRTNPSSKRALKGRLGYFARPKGLDEPFRARGLAEPALHRTGMINV